MSLFGRSRKRSTAVDKQMTIFYLAERTVRDTPIESTTAENVAVWFQKFHSSETSSRQIWISVPERVKDASRTPPNYINYEWREKLLLAWLVLISLLITAIAGILDALKSRRLILLKSNRQTGIQVLAIVMAERSSFFTSFDISNALHENSVDDSHSPSKWFAKSQHFCRNR